jgi:hypothetical protein
MVYLGIGAWKIRLEMSGERIEMAEEAARGLEELAG